MLELLPREVGREVQDYLRGADSVASKSWESAQEEEDAITGDFFGSLRTDEWSPALISNGRAWQWRVNYTKLRGRGPNAAEKELGADGLFMFELKDLVEERVRTKGLLFQAKKGRLGVTQELLEQVGDMEAALTGSSAVLVYQAAGFSALSGSDYLRASAEGFRAVRPLQRPIGEFLAEDFLECRAGARGLYYDSHTQLLTVPRVSLDGPTRVSVSHRAVLEVAAT